MKAKARGRRLKLSELADVATERIITLVEEDAMKIETQVECGISPVTSGLTNASARDLATTMRMFVEGMRAGKKLRKA